MKKYVLIFLVLLWAGWHLAKPVNFTGADLGRHIMNGELIVRGVWDVLYKNYYSYTFPDYPFINHHWFFGVLTYVLWHFFGFGGLSFLYVILELSAFCIFLRIGERFASLPLSCAFALLSIPLTAFRCEIRPEIFSMIFAGLYWQMINSCQEERLSPRRLTAGLLFLQVLWVNTHIFFILGPLLVGLFWRQAAIDGRTKQAGILKQSFWLVSAACLLNPSGLSGALLPFNVFRDLGYPINENQSLFTMLFEMRSAFSLYYYFPVILLSVLIGWGLLVQREGFKKHTTLIVLTVLLSVAAVSAVRFITLFGYFFIPLSCYVCNRFQQACQVSAAKRFVAVLLLSGLIVSATLNFNWLQPPVFGLAAYSNASADFFKKSGIKGPVFSNFSIGGYLIFHLGGQEKLFVDDRPESYPPQFMRGTVTAMLFDDNVWHDTDAKYRFNAIFLNRKDISAAGAEFILRRLKDPSWAVVFIDDYTIIFLKRNIRNASLIRLYERH